MYVQEIVQTFIKKDQTPNRKRRVGNNSIFLKGPIF